MIKEISIKNFKCLKFIQLNNLKTFNVIAGKNNIGKTTILDAIFSFYGVKNPGNLFNVNGFRNPQSHIVEIRQGTGIQPQVTQQTHPFWEDFFYENSDGVSDDYSIKITDSERVLSQHYTLIKKEQIGNGDLFVSIDGIQGDSSNLTNARSKAVKVEIIETPSHNKKGKQNEIASLEISMTNIQIKMELKKGSIEKIHLPTVRIITTTKAINKKTTSDMISKAIVEKKKEDLINNLKLIDERINDIAIISKGAESRIVLDIGLKEMSELSSMGEGISRTIDFFSSALMAKNNIILIDEIENGIHYSAIKGIIESLITTSKINNNQIFATTHSSDVIRAIYELSEFRDDISYVRLDKKENNNIYPTEYDREDIIYSVESDWEVR